MKKLLLLSVVALIVAATGIYGEGYYRQLVYQTTMSVGSDTTTAGNSQCVDTIGVTSNAHKFNAHSFRYLISAGTPVLHGLGNVDTAIITTRSIWADSVYTISTDTATTIPCTISVSYLDGSDSAWIGPNVQAIIQIRDTSADTTFTATYTVQTVVLEKEI